jgi:ATP-dependent helicase HrpB
VAPDADAGETVGTIRLAASLDEDEAGRLLEPFAVETTVVRWNGLAPRCVTVKSAGRLVLAERPLPCRDAADAVGASLAGRVGREGIGILPWDERSRGLLERIRFFAARTGAVTGDDADLARRAPEWLLPRVHLDGGPAIEADDLLAAVRTLVPGRRGDFERDVPAHLVLPTGTRCPIDYAGGRPSVEVRIQEVFGMKGGPVIGGVPLVFRLLSPARRPLQVTDDLARFWRSSYAEVRREMRGRYPKHAWPEDPATAAPTHGTRRRDARPRGTP